MRASSFSLERRRGQVRGGAGRDREALLRLLLLLRDEVAGELHLVAGGEPHGRAFALDDVRVRVGGEEPRDLVWLLRLVVRRDLGP
jgi:hypothetical protein